MIKCSISNKFNCCISFVVSYITQNRDHRGCDDDIWMDFLTSHAWAEIVHRRLVIFQIRACKLKRGVPGFQMNIILCLGCKSKTMGEQVDPSLTQTTAILLVPQTWWRQNKQKSANRADPSLSVNALIWKITSLIWTISA